LDVEEETFAQAPVAGAPSGAAPTKAGDIAAKQDTPAVKAEH